MGAELSYSRADPPESIKLGVQYTSADTTVWPHLLPLAQWFTASFARVVRSRLRERKSSGLLTFNEFWVLIDREGRLSDPAAQLWHKDILDLTSASLLSPKGSKGTNCITEPSGNPTTSTRPVLELYLQHVFHTFTKSSPSNSTARVYALEFLAGMVVISRAIWTLSDKVMLLAEIFLDPVSSGGVDGADCAGVVALKESDIALLILCVMRGVSKATLGIEEVWARRRVDPVVVSMQLATNCIRQVTSRQVLQPKSVSLTRKAPTVTQSEFCEYVQRTPLLRCFLALYSGEEMRNPSTFAGFQLMQSVSYSDKKYHARLEKQAAMYSSLLAQEVTFEGRQSKRRTSAATLIQSTWRRRCSRLAARHIIRCQVAERHASAAVVQAFVRRNWMSKQLENVASIERRALNGAVFTAGSGSCVGIPSMMNGGSREAQLQPLRLIESFKSLDAVIVTISSSSTFALALHEDCRTVFAWGKSFPRDYAERDGAPLPCLYGLQPRQLAYQFEDTRVVQISCGLRHALALTDNGMVFSWGFNDHGQLGHGPANVFAARTSGQSYHKFYDELSGREFEYLISPTKLLYFQGCETQQAEPIPIERVVCGDYYSIALSQDGDVFTWGEASEGQLGHGDAHPAFQVALVDRYMTNSAYTYLSQPEPVLALSDIRVVQIACQRNHVMALSEDARVFEWGNWGRRRGVDSEHAFSPMERMDAQAFRLRQIAIGDHHAIAEGASVWLALHTPATTDEPEYKSHTSSSAFYVETTLECSLDMIEREFIKNEASETTLMWKCHFVDVDFDDIGDFGNRVSIALANEFAAADASNGLWQRRIEKLALNSIEEVSRFDSQIRQLFNLGIVSTDTSTANQMNDGDMYSTILKNYLGNRVQRELVVFPRGKPEGYYIQFLIPPGEPAASSTTDDEGRTEVVNEIQHPTVVEFFVRGSNMAKRTITNRGFATQVYHPSMADVAKRLKQQQLRQKKRPTAEPTATNSLFVLEINEGVLSSWTTSDDDLNSLQMAAELDAEMIGVEITRRVLELQETGVLAVLVVLDLFDADAFDLDFPEDSGIYIPVFMLSMKTYGTASSSLAHSSHEQSSQDVQLWSINDIVSQLDYGQKRPRSAMNAARLPSLVELPPPLLARCFSRVDTASSRIEAAFEAGAAGVLFVKNPRDSTGDDRTEDFDSLPRRTHFRPDKPQRLVAMLPHDHGVRLRAATLAAQQCAEAQEEGANLRDLVVDVQFEIRPGGTTYAWGNAENGRLGLGADPGVDASDFYEDGYEALTDAAYRFIAAPTRIPALVGIEMKQLVCGSAHSLAVTTTGEVFSWGRGSHGQLAVAQAGAPGRHSEDHWEPQHVDGLQYESVAQVAASDTCSLFLTERLPDDAYLARRREIARLKAQAKKAKADVDEIAFSDDDSS